MSRRESNCFVGLGSRADEALFQFVEEERVDLLERRAIFGSNFVKELCHFLDDKFSHLCTDVKWDWVYPPYTPLMVDIGCVLKVRESSLYEALFEISNFLKFVMKGEGTCILEGTNVIVLVPPPFEDNSGLGSDLALLTI